jgi:hypothetical protein
LSAWVFDCAAIAAAQNVDRGDLGAEPELEDGPSKMVNVLESFDLVLVSSLFGFHPNSAKILVAYLAGISERIIGKPRQALS